MPLGSGEKLIEYLQKGLFFMHLRDDLEQLRITLAYLLQHSRQHVWVLLDHSPVVKLSCKVIRSHSTILP